MPKRVLLRDHPHRAVALATDSHVLTFRHSASAIGASTTSLGNQNVTAQVQCMVEFSTIESTDLEDYRTLSSLHIFGTLGLVSINNDIFLCVVNGASRVATVRPGENIQKITSVEFHCVNRSDYDVLLLDHVNAYSVDAVEEDGFDHRHAQPAIEHPCLALKKLLSGGSFYYSADFDLTRRLQDRNSIGATIALDSLDAGFLWNTYMIQPLVSFRSRLSEPEREALDDSRILTSAIRGFATTINVPASSSPVSTSFSGLPSSLTLVSRLSCRRAGTRFNSRGIDDDGNVANYVETETVFCAPSGMCFSYVQTRGSIPIFWEQAAGLPGQQKISITRSAEATQPAFDKHFAEQEINYGAVHIVNLLSFEKSGELELTRRYQYHVKNSPLNRASTEEPGKTLLEETDYDFHAETRGQGYEAASGIKRRLQGSADSFAYYLSEQVEDEPKTAKGAHAVSLRRPMTILQQEGIFRTNCLDCLDRTNLVQTIISQMAVEEFLAHRDEHRTTPDFWVRHSTLWADNGDALSKIYAGTGALKSSFTRSGKMSLAGALADVRKSATRLYINNFEDKGRQNTIDMLLGRLMGQMSVHLFDPINDHVSAELSKRVAEYSSQEAINLWVGTFNVNGRSNGMTDDLSPWLCPSMGPSQRHPEIVAVGFQEIVELGPQQIMSTDPHRRLAWEDAVKKTLNANAQAGGSEEYVLLRSGQLVGAALSVFVKASILPFIKNVEGAVKKTGMSGMAGNKGAVAIRMEYASTSICLVTAHLAAGFANYEERNQDYRTINHGLRFQRNRTIEDHDTIIWLGDFNYRIGMSNDRARQLIKAGDLETLYENDQLNLQMVHGRTFPYYTEARITFMPTYKYDNGTEQYDTSDKARIPAWCDRILTKGNNLRQLQYNTAPLRFSDHRPVYATFQCTISAVDEKAKQRISNELYLKRREIIGNVTATNQAEDSDDAELLGYDSIEPGLPPASSDKRKWWLDGGVSARSKVRAPGNGSTPNANSPSNPFAPTSEPDWVKVEKPSPAPSLRSASQQQDHPPPRKLPPAWDAADNVDGASDVRSQSSARTPGARKPAPVVPKKPTLLRSESSQSNATRTTSLSPARQKKVGTASSVAANTVPYPPPPRRSVLMTPAPAPAPQLPVRRAATAAATEQRTARTVAGGDAGSEEDQRTPTLPPRRTSVAPSSSSSASRSASLMDDGGEGNEMREWAALRPQ